MRLGPYLSLKVKLGIAKKTGTKAKAMVIAWCPDLLWPAKRSTFMIKKEVVVEKFLKRTARSSSRMYTTKVRLRGTKLRCELQCSTRVSKPTRTISKPAKN